ncbi:MAG: hypothetical protein FJ134_17515 [Deltaproteobacteria bacterium]|nr:hypothetical protein [Deltaproteobacteria bacterium]
MTAIVLSVSRFLHLAATVIWVGGIWMILLVILPGAKTALESAPMAGKLMKEITRRFTPMVNISIPVLIITGLIIGHLGKNITNPLDLYNHWTPVMLVKHLLVALMVVIHFYRGWLLTPKIGRLSSRLNESPEASSLSIQVAGLQKFSLNLVKTNLALGLMVIFLSGIRAAM